MLTSRAIMRESTRFLNRRTLAGRRGARIVKAMDIVFIKALKLDALIGVNAWERRIRQAVSIDLEMATDIRAAATSDAIADTLDYKAVSKRVSAIVRDSEFQLVESLAERITSALIAEFRIPWLKLTITKPGAVRGSAGVGIMIERGIRT